MKTKEEQIEILELMSANENTVAKLYAAYAEKTPDHADFWRELSEDEVQHAAWINEMKEKVEKGEVVVKGRGFSKEHIRESIDDIREEIGKVQNTGLSYLTHEEELEISLEKEKGLLEKKFFRVFKTDDDELKELLKKLKKETEGHHKKIKEELHKEKHGG